MVECNKTVMDAINLAMDAEQKASQFYATAAKRVSSAKGKQMFLQLSEFEQGHYEVLGRLKESLSGEGCFISYQGTSFKPIYVEGSVLEISADEKKDVSEILTMAIKNEKSAGEAYEKLAGEIDDPQGVAMFKRLAGEEADHARILEDQFYDINNKGMWTWDA
jgi:rubrerythrin